LEMSKEVWNRQELMKASTTTDAYDDGDGEGVDAGSDMKQNMG